MPERESMEVDPDRLKEVGESAVNTVLDRVGRGIAKVQERSPLAYDLLESDDAYLVVFDAPGAERSDVQVRFNDDAVEVRVDRFRDFHEGFDMRFPGRGLALDGRAELPPGAAVEPTEATSTLTDHGTLRVRLPKRAGGTVAVADADDAESAALDEDDDEPVTLDTGDGEGADAGADTDADTGDGAHEDESELSAEDGDEGDATDAADGSATAADDSEMDDDR